MKAALAFCGKLGSGKSTACSFVAREFGFQLVSFGGFVRHQLVQDGSPITRRSMQNAGDSLYRSLGPVRMLDDTLAHFGVCIHSSVVFDGIRHSEVLTAIKQKAIASFAIYLDASRDVRFKRCQMKQGHSLQIEDFDRVDGHPVESGIPDLAKQCDLILDTSAPVNVVQERLGTVIRRWR